MINVGSRLKLKGISMLCELVEIDQAAEVLVLRRVHPETGELEPGEPLRMPAAHVNIEYVDYIEHNL